MVRKKKTKEPSQVSESTPRQEQLLLVALDLFSRQDFSTVTIKNIAVAADVNTALIYYYFKDKKHLFRSALEFAVLRLIEQYRKLRVTHEHPVYLMRHWFANNVKMFSTFRQLIKITLDYNSRQDRDFSITDLIEQFYREEEQNILSGCIQRGEQMGIFKAVDPDATARFISVHLDGIMTASLVRRNFDIATSVHQLESFMWKHLEYAGDLPVVQ